MGERNTSFTKVTEDERYCIDFSKSYDVRYDFQTIFTGIKMYE